MAEDWKAFDAVMAEPDDVAALVERLNAGADFFETMESDIGMPILLREAAAALTRLSEERDELLRLTTVIAGMKEKARAEKAEAENWQLRQALGYSIPADKDTPQNPFKCGMCEANHLRAEKAEAEVARLSKGQADYDEREGWWGHLVWEQRDRAEKAEAEVTRLREDLRLAWQKIGTLQARAEKAEAALQVLTDQHTIHMDILQRCAQARHEAEAALAERDKRIAEVEQTRGTFSRATEAWAARAEQAEAERDELKRERDELDFLLHEGGTWEQQLRKAEAEVTRLREALEQIERYSADDHVKRRARAALEPGEKP